jgi:hypothetical protein
VTVSFPGFKTHAEFSVGFHDPVPDVLDIHDVFEPQLFRKVRHGKPQPVHFLGIEDAVMEDDAGASHQDVPGGGKFHG